jgi:hypothetical protein
MLRWVLNEVEIILLEGVFSCRKGAQLLNNMHNNLRFPTYEGRYKETNNWLIIFDERRTKSGG